MTTTDAQIASFLEKYTPVIAAQLSDARARLRAMFPHGFELVFDNYNALVFAISATERRNDAFVSVVGYPRWVTLFFLRGVDLHDPKGLLEGTGKQVRSIRLKAAEDLSRPDIQALIAQASQPHAEAFRIAPPLTTVVKMALAAQRSRRPSPTAPKTRTPRPPRLD